MIAAREDIVDRALVAAHQLRAAAEETRRALQTSRDLVERSRQQTRSAMIPPRAAAPDADDPGPSDLLVKCLIRAYELAEDDGEPRTHALLGRVITHVGRRIAAVVNPRAAEVVMH